MYLKLSQCDINKCEAMCCYDGAYLAPHEEEFIYELVNSEAELLKTLPDEFIVDGYWQGEYYGRKTATRLHNYKSSTYPSHFSNTRCVFADSDGYCEFEKMARKRLLHPWTFKPSACWLFPLTIRDNKVYVPPLTPLLDSYWTPEYEGYSSAVPCGKHDPNGNYWWETLSQELQYLNIKNILTK